MCNGQAGALPNTHSTLTATLVVQSSMPSVFVIAPTASTTRSTMSTATSAPSSTFITATRSSSIMSSTPSATSAAASLNSAVTKTTLTEGQIIGITVATAGGGFVAVLIVILIACIRRRRRRRYERDRESDLIPFQLEPKEVKLPEVKAPAQVAMDPSSYQQYENNFKEASNIIGPGGPVAGLPSNPKDSRPPVSRSPPRPTRLNTSSPDMFSAKNIIAEEQPQAIGMAMSPEDEFTMRQQRRSSKLLPEKPSLKLKMPQSGEKPQTGALNFAQSAISRQSTGTQFELDDDESAINSSGGWGRTPISALEKGTGQLQTIRAAPAPAIVEGGGVAFHWRPGQQVAKQGASAYKTQPLNVANFPQPPRTDSIPRLQQQQPPHLTIPEPAAVRPTTSNSLNYSFNGSTQSGNLSRNNSQVQKSYKQVGPYDHQRAGSLQSYEIVDNYVVSPEDHDPRAAELSPVVESPASGRSPVSYPRIPKRMSQNEVRFGLPPPQPDFAKSFGGVAGEKPWRQAELEAAREREQLNNRPTTQLPMMPITPLPIQDPNSIQIGIDEFIPPPPRSHLRRPSQEKLLTRRPSQSQSSRENISRAPSQRMVSRTPSVKSNSNFVAPPPPPRSASQPQYQPYRPSKQNDALTSTTWVPQIPTVASPKPPITPHTQSRTSSQPYNPLSAHPSVTFTRSSSQLSHASTSTTSSLLAKRRGEQKANMLMLKNEEDKKRQMAKWRVLNREEREEAKKEGWRPKAGRDGEEQNGPLSGRMLREFEQTELPVTPGWVPKLTPTRRGDDLFLSVA